MSIYIPYQGMLPGYSCHSILRRVVDGCLLLAACSYGQRCLAMPVAVKGLRISLETKQHWILRSLTLRINTSTVPITKLLKASPLRRSYLNTLSLKRTNTLMFITCRNPAAKAVAHGTQEETEDQADKSRESRAHLTEFNIHRLL